MGWWGNAKRKEFTTNVLHFSTNFIKNQVLRAWGRYHRIPEVKLLPKSILKSTKDLLGVEIEHGLVG